MLYVLLLLICCRKLRSETLHLQQELAQYRIQMADLTRDVQRYGQTDRHSQFDLICGV